MTDASVTRPEDAHWEAWDRNRLLKLVERLPDTIRVGVSHHGGRTYSVFRVWPWPSRSVHLLFDDWEGSPQAVSLMKTLDGKTSSNTWLAGGLRAWVDALEIDRDELLEALLSG